MALAWIGLGSNIEPRRAHLLQGIQGLSRAPLALLGLSRVYETQPMDVLDQPRFLNMGAAIETSATPLELLRLLQAIEAEAGKKVVVRRGPRTLDLDIWAYDALSMDTPELTIPHPRIAERPFVLVPLMEVAPQWRHPISGLSAGEMLQRLPKPWPEVRLLGPLSHG
jgi:2-amino-4-hydroxy-6-hydroxymethyldihydropteridine diphosphokinase